jgi:catechol 2,3-dioxygenase-like lactoylglutathione lyase family enzyme
VFGVLHVIIDVPAPVADRATEFWSTALGWPAGEPWPEHPEFRSLEPPTGTAYVHVQTGDHGPRIHVDLEVDEVETETSRLRAMGATVMPRRAYWTPLVSPGGLPLCLVPWRAPSVVPGPLVTPDGNRLRLVQVCLDAPRSLSSAETEFWRAATGWRWVASADEAFDGKLHHDGASPVQLLLQRLGDSDAGLATRAHIDLGADDREAAVRRLVDLGASRGPTGDGWIVLTDPVGMDFCVTGNAPD